MQYSTANLNIDDLKAVFNGLMSARQEFDTSWEDIRRYALPYQAPHRKPDQISGPGGIYNSVSLTQMKKEAQRIYSTLASRAAEVVPKNIQSLTMPSDQFWHSYSVGNLKNENGEPVSENKLKQQIKNELLPFIFNIRYDQNAGLDVAAGSVLRDYYAYGTGVLMPEKNPSYIKAPIRYKHIPITQCYMNTNDCGSVTTLFIPHSRTAIDLKNRFPDRVSEDVTKKAADAEQARANISVVRAIIEISEAENYGYRREARPRAC